jgi:hypothetical protein
MKKQIKHRSELHLLLNDPKTAKIAEVGVAEGRFSLEILNWGINHLYLVDIWETKNFFGDAASPQSWHDSNYNEAKERVSNFSNNGVLAFRYLFNQISFAFSKLTVNINF